jgi:hypothetical protein
MIISVFVVMIRSVCNPSSTAAAATEDPQHRSKQHQVFLESIDDQMQQDLKSNSMYFTSLEGEFEWSQYQNEQWMEYHISQQQQEVEDAEAVIVANRDVERRLGIDTNNMDDSRSSHLHLRGKQRNMKTYYNNGSGSGDSGDDGDDSSIYVAGDLSKLQVYTISQSLQKHDNVAFIKRWRGSNHLIVTQQCSIKNKSEPGAYYCVDNKTVCVAVKSMPRFYGKHMSGGKCGTFPLNDDTVSKLPEAYQEAYASTCGDGDKCEGR